MKQWKVMDEQTQTITLDGTRSTDPSYYDSAAQLHILMSFRKMLYGGMRDDFLLKRERSKRKVSYKMTYRLEKFEGGV